MIIEDIIELMGNEHYWRDFLIKHTDLIEEDFILSQSEFSTYSPYLGLNGRIDIVGIDKNSNVCLIELKLFPSEKDIQQIIEYYTNLFDTFNFFLKDIEKVTRNIRLIIFGICNRHIPFKCQQMMTKYGKVIVEFNTFNTDDEKLLEYIKEGIYEKDFIKNARREIRKKVEEKFCSVCKNKDFDRLCDDCNKIYKSENSKIKDEILQRLDKIEW